MTAVLVSLFVSTAFLLGIRAFARGRAEPPQRSKGMLFLELLCDLSIGLGLGTGLAVFAVVTLVGGLFASDAGSPEAAQTSGALLAAAGVSALLVPVLGIGAIVVVVRRWRAWHAA